MHKVEGNEYEWVDWPLASRRQALEGRAPGSYDVLTSGGDADQAEYVDLRCWVFPCPYIDESTKKRTEKNGEPEHRELVESLELG